MTGEDKEEEQKEEDEMEEENGRPTEQNKSLTSEAGCFLLRREDTK